MTTPDPWGDDRLEAAFAARAAATGTPPDLVAATTDELRRAPRPLRRPWRIVPIAAAAAVIVSVIGVSLALSWRAGSTPAPTVPSAPPPASAPLPTASAALGLRVMDVPAAIAVRDGGEDDVELAVRGWFSPSSAIECPAPSRQPVSPVEPNCPDPWVVLMAEPESLFTVADDHSEGHLPSGDAFQLEMDGLDTSALPSMPDLGPAVPSDLVVIGHFDDRRSRLCPADVDQACRDRFVVDRIESVDGETLALSHVTMIDEGAPKSTLDEVLSTLADLVPDTVVLSVVTTDEANIGSIEPTLGAGLPASHDGFAVAAADRWVIRTLEAGKPRTYVVTDGTDDVWLIDIDGNLFRFARRLETPTPSERPWPPEGTSFTVRITKDVDDRPPFEVAIVDRSGTLASAREATGDDPVAAIPDDGASAWVQAEPGDPRSVRLGWFGGNCDRRTIVTIESTTSILVDPNVAEPCNVTGYDRSLILTYSDPIDVAAIDVAYGEAEERPGMVATPTPTPSSPAYRDGRLAVVGVDGGPGELFCNQIFPVSGLTAPTGAEDRLGPEFDVLRATLADPGFADGAADIDALSWREAGRTDDTVVFLAEKERNGDERFWVELAVRHDGAGWRFDGGGDCQPRAVLPVGVGPATWMSDPAFAGPGADDTTVHLLVTELACASAQPADDRLVPAYVVADPYRIEITIGVRERPGGQDCPGNPPTRSRSTWDPHSATGHSSIPTRRRLTAPAARPSLARCLVGDPARGHRQEDPARQRHAEQRRVLAIR